MLRLKCRFDIYSKALLIPFKFFFFFFLKIIFETTYNILTSETSSSLLKEITLKFLLSLVSVSFKIIYFTLKLFFKNSFQAN